MKEQLQTGSSLSAQDLGPIPTPMELHSNFVVSEAGQASVAEHRQQISQVMHKWNDRMLVVVGPCSLDADKIDGRFAAQVFADKLFEADEKHGLGENLKLVLRMPPAKPRTETGWSGLEQTDMPTATQILTNLTNDGRPLAMEVMEERHFARFGDRLTLGWVGARNVGNTILRHSVSAHPELPVFFKNSMEETGRSSLLTAVAATKVAASSQPVEIMLADGSLMKIMSAGNPNTGIIFRGNAHSNPHSFKAGVWDTLHIGRPVLVDVSHQNAQAHNLMRGSSKALDIVAGQIACLNSLMEEIELDHMPTGIMIESNLIEGQGKMPGQSKTDPCIGIDQTIDLLATLAKTVGHRRSMRDWHANRKLW